MLEREADPADLLDDRLIVEDGLALGRREQPGEQPGERRLPRTIAPHDEHRVGGRDVEVDAHAARGGPTACPPSTRSRRRAGVTSGAPADEREGESARRGVRRRLRGPSATTTSAARDLVGAVGERARPSARRRSGGPAAMTSRRSRPAGSSIAVDSSEIRSAGRRASAAATANRWSWPPDRVIVSRSPRPAEPHKADSAPRRRPRLPPGGPTRRRRAPARRAPGFPDAGTPATFPRCGRGRRARSLDRSLRRRRTREQAREVTSPNRSAR